MSIACPFCAAGLTPKALLPGIYTPKCPSCSKPIRLMVLFRVLTSEDDDLSTTPRPAAPKKSPSVEPPAENVRIKTSPARKAAAPVDDDELIEPTPPPRKPTAKPIPPTARTPKPEPVDPNATGDFTEVDKEPVDSGTIAHEPEPEEIDRDVTEAIEAKHPTPKASKPAATSFDATGDFTEAKSPSPDATGDFSEDNEPDLAAATRDFSPSAEDLPPERSAAFANEVSDPHATGAFGGSQVDADAPTQPNKMVPAKKAAPEEPKPAKKSKAKADAAPDMDVPVKLGGYEVLRVLGKGGMGAVLLGRQISLDREVALKVMHPKIAKNPSFVARFTREAYAAAQLTHHNVIQIYDIGEDRGQHFFSMEFVQGQSLMDMVKEQGKLTTEAAVGYTLQAARGLRYGHKQGMVHRDIKPDNLMVNTEGIVKVADLGLVKLPSGELSEQAGSLPPADDDGPGDSNLTRAGAVMGTPAYMSPEQSRDSAAVDVRADIYSLGCSLYVLVTGKTPFEGKTAMEIISKHQTQPMTPPEMVVKRVPKKLSAIILKMTAKKPEDRFQTMDELIAVLEGFLGLEKSGTFNPKEEQADQLEKCCHQFNYRSKDGLKRKLWFGFFVACLLGIVGGAFAGNPALAGGLVGLMAMAPLAYFGIHGTFTGSLLFRKTRQLLFGMRFFDMLMWFGSGMLFLATLYLFGMLWSWLGFAAFAGGIGFVIWFITDRAGKQVQQAPIEETRELFRTLRLSGLDEEQLRQFACKFAGDNWEPFYESLFGYEAMRSARAYRKGDAGEVSKKSAPWRETFLAMLDAKLDARKVARERKYLQKLEAKALEAEGVSRSEAKAQANAIAAELVEKADEAKQARKEGKEASVQGMVASVRERRMPKPGHNIAGKKLRNLWFKDFMNEWFGRRLRLILGALTFAIGLFWMNDNRMFDKSSNIFKQVVELDFAAVQKSLDRVAGRPLRLPEAVPVPVEILQALGSINVPILGLLMIVSGVWFFGWRSSLVAVPGLVVGIAGPMLGVPAVGPLSAPLLCLLVGGLLIIGIGWLLRS